MSQSKSTLPLSTLWQKNETTPEIIDTLINQIEKPAIVFDLKKNIIIQANSKFLKISSYTNNELKQNNPVDIFPDVHNKRYFSGKSNEITLVSRGKDKTKKTVQCIPISEKTKTVLFIVEENQCEVNEDSINQIEFANSIYDLISSYQYIETTELIESIIATLSTYLINQNIAIFKYFKSINGYKKISSVENEITFPEFVPKEDLVLESAIVLWEKGKIVENDLQRLCRSKNVSNLLVNPFGTNINDKGCIVVAGDTPLKNELIQMILKIYGGLIKNAYYDQAQKIGTKLSLAKNSKVLFEQEKIVENIDVGIITVNSDLIVQKMNPSAEIMLGYINDEIIGEGIENLLIGTDNLYTALESARNNIHTPNLGNSTLHRRNGQAFPAQIQVYPISDNNNLLSIAIFIYDISENEKIRRRSQQLEQRAVIGELTAIFAHEVRNPINNISTGLQLLDTKLNSEDGNKDLVNRMRADCNRLTNLMDSVLAFSRPMEPKFEKLDIIEFIERLINKWNSRLARVKILHHLSYEENIPNVFGDPRALEQVFTNLINNAIEVMKETGGTLAVKIKTNYDISKYKQVEITLADNGPGIPDDIKKRIFEPFVSASSNGTGLGLAITKRIITAHRGSINVESFPGGTIFKILLPEANGEEHGPYNTNS